MAGSMQRMRAELVQSLELSAEWRTQKAEEYPDDHRNARSAAALTAAAREVAALPDDDPHLERIERAYATRDDNTTDMYLEEQNILIGRHGFDVYPGGTDPTTDDLLTRLAEVAERATINSLEARLE